MITASHHICIRTEEEWIEQDKERKWKAERLREIKEAMEKWGETMERVREVGEWDKATVMGWGWRRELRGMLIAVQEEGLQQNVWKESSALGGGRAW